MHRLALLGLTSVLGLAACGPALDDDALDTAADVDRDGFDFGESAEEDEGVELEESSEAAAAAPCTTRITYGSAWLRPNGHAASYDDVAGRVTWDGVCHSDGGNSFAVLSNGWRPYFRGASACIIALDARGTCAGAPTACTTRVTYGPRWLKAHPAIYDDVPGVVTWDGACRAQPNGQSSATLSNGWTPHFQGGNACAISLRHQQCGGLFANPTVASDCPDPGVVKDGSRYVMACTGGDFALRTSRDLVHWTRAGTIFAPGRRPRWASGDFWAPEIHKVGNQWIAYYSARNASDRSLAIGAATGPTATGPFTDIGRPLIHVPHPGVIDVHFFAAPDGRRYLLWKADGNAVGAATPIYGQELSADGLRLVGTRRRLITNDQRWEGGLVEGPWMIHHGGMYYLFYSGNGYASTRYGVGVARSSSPLGPFAKASAPILTSNGTFAGPGHGSVVRGPRGDWVHVYHAWRAGRVGESPGRQVLVDRITWANGWPRMLGAPSTRSQPLP